MGNKQELRDIKISIIEGKYWQKNECISSYTIPKDVEEWLPCPNCGLKPLTWEFKFFNCVWMW